MSYTERIRVAARIAKVMGYRVAKDTSESGYGFMDVYCPKGRKVTYWTGHNPVTEEQALGHFLVRLHMERHYGIRTEHYWM